MNEQIRILEEIGQNPDKRYDDAQRQEVKINIDNQYKALLLSAKNDYKAFFFAGE